MTYLASQASVLPTICYPSLQGFFELKRQSRSYERLSRTWFRWQKRGVMCRDFTRGVATIMNTLNVKQKSLPTRASTCQSSEFGRLMHPVMQYYKIDCFDWGKKNFLHWYNQCSFTTSIAKQLTVYVGNYVELLIGEFAMLKHIYTYCPPFENVCRVFFLRGFARISLLPRQGAGSEYFLQNRDQLHYPIRFIQAFWTVLCPN